ncbi:hypothetical protein RLOC_00013690 [Lonchura striata]|uniref:Uncharacterized protein n=1 Tax=Lonchura striata TaxID=40157 RepID=A0A218V4Z2_9PASE|nr:hypothetical protein RLOC_00013690 [Lonchura striata domestica]
MKEENQSFISSDVLHLEQLSNGTLQMKQCSGSSPRPKRSCQSTTAVLEEKVSAFSEA